MKTIAIKMADGSVEIMSLVSGTPQAAIAKWPPSKSKDVVSFREITLSELPQDRTFRDSWEDIGTIGVNMPKAREILRKYLGEATLDSQIESAQTPEELLQITIVRSI